MRQEKQYQQPESGDEMLVSKARQHLDQSLDQFSPHAEQSLRQARQAALEAAGKKTVWSAFWAPAQIGAAFALGLMLVMVWPSLNQNTQTPALLAFEAQLEDLILASELDDDTLELVEDIEFAYWLAQQVSEDLEDTTLPVDETGDRPLEGAYDTTDEHPLQQEVQRDDLATVARVQHA